MYLLANEFWKIIYRQSFSLLFFRSISLPIGTEVFSIIRDYLRTDGDVTNVAGLGRDSQKALPRSCLGLVCLLHELEII